MYPKGNIRNEDKLGSCTKQLVRNVMEFTLEKLEDKNQSDSGDARQITAIKLTSA